MRPSPCLLLLVSWLLVAFIPGLLMLATFGLDRLEAGLAGGSVSTDDVDEYLEHAKAESLRRPLRPEPVPLADFGEPLPLREPRYDGYALPHSVSGLPTRVYVQHRVNPQFQPTRQADRV